MSVRLRMKEPITTICHSCHWGIVTEFKDRAPMVHCKQMGGEMGVSQVPPTVTECTQYEKRGATAWDLEKIAWVLEVGKGKKIGFKRPTTQSGIQYEEVEG